MKTPLSSDNIFIENIRKVTEIEELGTGTAPAKLSPEKYPLTRLVMACPLWRFYIKPDDETPESIFDMLQCFWPDHTDQMDQVSYIDIQHNFDNLYYIYNALVIRRKIEIDVDLRTPLGKRVNVFPNPQKIVSRSLVGALEQAIQKGMLTKDKLAEMDDGTDDFGKNALNQLYISVPSIDALWSNATAKTRQSVLKGLKALIGNDSARKL